MRKTIAATVVVIWCIFSTFVSDAAAAALQTVEFQSASQKLLSGPLIPGDRIRGYLAKPKGTGPFPAVVVLHGCAGMHVTTRQRVADQLVARGYAVFFVDSYATRRLEHACTTGANAAFVLRRQDAYGALVYLSRQSFVDPGRIAVVGFSAGGRVALSVAEGKPFEQLIPETQLRFRAAAAFYPPCLAAQTRPEIPALILTGALDNWTPATNCSAKVESWGDKGAPVELVIYPGTHHGFYYPHLRRGVKMFRYRLEYNNAAASNAALRLREFLDWHLK